MTQREWSNWMCPGCGTSDLWFTERTDCCGRRTVGAYSDVRCPFCSSNGRHGLSGWLLYTDGVTRPCACSSFSLEPHWPVPNPTRTEGLSAAVLGIVIDALIPGIFVVPTPPIGTEPQEK